MTALVARRAFPPTAEEAAEDHARAERQSVMLVVVGLVLLVVMMLAGLVMT